MSLIEKIKAALLKGLGAAADPAQVEAMAKEIAADAEAGRVTLPADTTQQAPVQGIATIEQLQSLIKAEVKPIQDLLAKAETEKETAQRALAEQKKTEQAAKVKGLLEKAVADGKIAPTNAELMKSIETMATNDYDGAERLLTTMPATIKTQTTPVKTTENAQQPAMQLPGAAGDALRAAAAEAWNNKLAIN